MQPRLTSLARYRRTGEIQMTSNATESRMLRLTVKSSLLLLVGWK